MMQRRGQVAYKYDGGMLTTDEGNSSEVGDLVLMDERFAAPNTTTLD